MQRSLYIVDADVAMRDLIGVVFSLEGYNVRGFAHAAEALFAARTRCPSCLILDGDAGREAFDFLCELHVAQCPAPVFILIGKTPIPQIVKAIKHGAHDIIEKPFDAEDIINRVNEAVDATWRENSETGPEISLPDALRLTRREVEVLKQVTGGASNKEAGRTLGISPRTVEVHRSRIMDKLGARNTADLVRMVLKMQESGGRPPYSAAMAPKAASLS